MRRTRERRPPSRSRRRTPSLHRIRARRFPSLEFPGLPEKTRHSRESFCPTPTRITTAWSIASDQKCRSTPGQRQSESSARQPSSLGRALRSGLPANSGTDTSSSWGRSCSRHSSSTTPPSTPTRSSSRRMDDGLFYTGDVRLHGRKAATVERLLRSPPSRVHVLLMEGTQIGRPQTTTSAMSERDVEERARAIFTESEGLVLCFFSPQNVDRLVSLFRAAKRSDRTFVYDLYAASVARATGRRTIPQPEWPEVRVYLTSNERRKVIASERVPQGRRRQGGADLPEGTRSRALANRDALSGVDGFGARARWLPRRCAGDLVAMGRAIWMSPQVCDAGVAGCPPHPARDHPRLRPRNGRGPSTPCRGVRG